MKNLTYFPSAKMQLSLVVRAVQLAIVSAACAAQSVAAQSIDDVAVQLPAVVVTASRLPQTLSDTIASTTLITRSDIERSGAVDLPALLSSYAGIQFGRNGGVGQASNIFMRGTNARNTLVLIDGAAVNDQNDGTARMELIPLDVIERIELVRGNVSAEYGSNAVGGVIQIFTRTAKQSGGTINAELGSQGHRKLAVTASLLAGNTSLLASASRSTVNGISSGNPAQNPLANPDHDGSKLTVASLNIGHRIDKDLKFGLHTYTSQQRSQYDDDYNGTLSSDDFIRQRMSQLGGFIDWQINAVWQTQLKMSSQSQTGRSAANNAPVNTNDNHRKFFSWQNNLNAGALGTFLLAAESERTNFKGESFGAYGYATPFHKRTTNALLAGWQGKAAGLGWNLNTRRDNVNNAAVSTYSAGVSYDLTANWSVRGSTANAFNRATLGQVFDPYYGNTALKAERANNRELGVQWTHANNLVKLTYHRSNTLDMFGFDPITYQTINIGEVNNKGLELMAELGMPWSGGKLRLNANTQNPVNQATGALLARRAKTQGNVGLQGTTGAWLWDVSAAFMGTRNDTDYNTYAGVVLKANTKLDASLNYTVNPKTSVGLYLTNINKANDQTAYGYSGTPRGASLRFNIKL